MLNLTNMSDSQGVEINGGQLQDFTIDQLAGALALSLGAVGTLLLVIWQSRCLCRCRLGLSDKCYIFDCERAPPPLEEDEEKDKKKEPPVNKETEEVEPNLVYEEDKGNVEVEPILPIDVEPEPEPEPDNIKIEVLEK